MSIESLARRFGTNLRWTRISAAVLIGAFVLVATACGGGQEASGERSGKNAAGEMTRAGATTSDKIGASSDEAAELARAEVGKKEISNMMPDGGKKPDPARPLPDDPPEGIEVYPATTNATVRGPIEYDREPPTNGDHDPLWQNCGFYEKPIRDRHAVHSLDHGVVWITYRPNLPAGQVNELRSYGDERYVLISPYPGQDATVIATSWRVQLELNGADDPRLRRFVNQFRISELAPLSGNHCVGGVGRPET